MNFFQILYNIKYNYKLIKKLICHHLIIIINKNDNVYGEKGVKHLQILEKKNSIDYFPIIPHLHVFHSLVHLDIILIIYSLDINIIYFPIKKQLIIFVHS